jgi:predicted esterase YcpF (UPF0227 family)
MKKVLYLHGLESKQGGPKVDFLADEFIVHAPKINYKDPTIQNQLDFVMRQFQPDLIIGSSMGGYVADILSQKYGVSAILFNPAVHNRSFEPTIEPLIEGEQADLQQKKIVVLGKNDEVIPPYMAQIMFENNRYYEVVFEEMGHQTPLSVFINTINVYQNQL